MSALKEKKNMCSFLKRPSLDPTVFDNYQQVLHILCLGKVGEKMFGLQLISLEKTDYLDMF